MIFTNNFQDPLICTRCNSNLWIELQGFHNNMAGARALHIHPEYYLQCCECRQIIACRQDFANRLERIVIGQ